MVLLSLILKLRLLCLTSAKSCGPPVPPRHGSVSLPCNIKYHSTCPVSCHDGYILRGSPIIKCDIVYGKLQWDKRKIFCEGNLIYSLYPVL